MNIQKYKFICSNGNELWKKELHLILNRDIHEKGLGCCVRNTHIKIGNVHLGEFFEAQFLFGNAYWISIFSNALKKQFEELNNDKNENVLIIGYETYVEPVLLQLIELLRKDGYNVNYCIYEEPRYILKDRKSDVRLRMEKSDSVNKYEKFFIICGISSTLNTYRQIISLIAKEKNYEFKRVIQSSKFCSVIQVLPNVFEKEKYTYDLNDDGTEKIELVQDKNNCLKLTFGKQDFEKIEAKYLVNIFCEWQSASNCKWCFDENEERPIIATNEASVIPIQMIGNKNIVIAKDKSYSQGSNINIQKIDFFQKDKNKDFLYCNYLYYNHIERDSHHFQYYIRTNSLIKAIIENENDKLDLFCSQVNSVLFESESSSDKSRRIDVIVVPIHYSNEHFLNIIAKKIFKNSVEIIAFDPQKEYRSNFETKYSNYAYVIEASASKTCVHFHFVDDQIITGHTFYQAKSFVNSLVRSTITNTLHKGEKPKVIVFDSIITMVDRNSNSSKSNYITDVSRFFSLIDICVPSMRNHGDSCHLCSKSKNAELIKRNSALYGMSKYWEEKETYYTVKMLQDAKGIALAQNMEMTKRKFRRFYCENLLWKKLKNDWGSDKHIYIELVTLIAAEISKLDRKNQYEYIISFIKVMSKPFIYYRENFKKAVHAMMLYFTFIINKNYNINPSKIFYILKHVPYGTHKDVYKHIEKSFNALNENHINHTCFKEKYYLYIILLSRLCAINSNYLLKYNNIENALYFYDEISYNFSLNEQNEIKPISDNIAHLIKSVTNGISGKHKAKKLDFELINSKINSKYLTIVRNIYLENLEADAETEEKENLFSIGVSTRQKYINVLKRLVKNSSAWFMTNLYQSSNCFPLAENIINGEKIMSFFEDEKFNRGEDICFTTDFVGIKCYQSENNQDIVYLIIQNSNNPEELDFEGLKFIRSILKFRYALYNELEKDIHSGAIKELYQDDKWLEIFAQPKVVSHGQSEDIEKHLKNIENKFLLYQSYENRVEPKYSDIVSDLTLFSNLLISFLYSKKIADDRDLKYKFSEQLEIVELKYIKTMHSNNEKNTDQNGLLNFDDYRSLLKNENLYELFIERFNYYLGCMCRHGVEIDLIIDEIKMIDSVISFQSSYKYSIWFSIVIIHTLIKNAIQHGDKSEKISIHMQKRENSIDLIVKNKTLNNLLYSGKGITKKALQHAFESKPFSISFEDIKETNEFIVKITNFFGGVT